MRQLKEHLQEIAESFKNQYDDITQWTFDVKKYQKVMDPELGHDKNVLSQRMVLSQFLAAVEAAGDVLIQMEQEDSG